MKHTVVNIILSCILLLTGCGLSFSSALAAEVNIYSARKDALIKPILKRYTEKTGIAVNLITGNADTLIKRLEVEGLNSPADILLTVDAARLYRAVEKNLLQPVKTSILESAVPEVYRHPEGYWYGLSVRSRVIVYAADRVSRQDLSSYESLAEQKWHKKICVRSSSNIYNQSLVASLIAHLGLENTETWAHDLVNNFARDPKGGDRDQIMAVAAGQCDIALVNTYYLGGMYDSKIKNEHEAAKKVSLFWPNQDGRGAHVNISGAGITRSAVHIKEATALLEFLVSDEAQQWYAEKNYEFPVKPGVNPSNRLSAWGAFKSDTLNLQKLGEHNSDAVKLMDRAGWK